MTFKKVPIKKRIQKTHFIETEAKPAAKHSIGFHEPGIS